LIVRLLIERRRGTEVTSRGDTLDMPVEEAALLIERGEAIPVAEDFGREQR
jgi:hypothetical protein